MENKSYVKLFLMLVILLLSSCSSPTDVIENSIGFQKGPDQIIISNNSESSIYIFAVEQGTAALINWIPNNDHPKIDSKSIYLLKYSDIFKSSTEKTKPGDTVIIYYWKESLTQKPEIHSKVVTL